MKSRTTPFELSGWRQMFWEARTRILIWYLVLMSLSSGLSVLIVRQLLVARLEERVQQSLQQEIAEFRQLRQGNDPETGTPFNDDVAAIFDVFLSRNIPEDGEYLVAIANGEFYSASSLALPEALQPDDDLMQYWSQITQAHKGTFETPSGTLLFQAEPVYLQTAADPRSAAERVGGVFVVAYLTAGERAELEEAVRVVAQVSLGVLAIASLLAWLAAGRVLAPLRLLSQTARSISEANLTERIPVRGRGDIAELAVTFNDMMDRLEATFNSQREFLNDVGHELRTPITIIRGHLELMNTTSDEQQETCDIVLDELDRISRFVHDLVLLAKAERPDFLLLETIDVETFTEELYIKIQTLGDRRWQLEAIAQGRLLGDRQRLTEAIVNLAQNACQHTQVGDTICLGSAPVAKQFHFWIRDTGEGISPDDQQRIFERFVRGESQHHHADGTGLGLAIVRAIAHAHDGTIALQSRLGQGAKFTLVIPLKPCQEMHP